MFLQRLQVFDTILKVETQHCFVRALADHVRLDVREAFVVCFFQVSQQLIVFVGVRLGRPVLDYNRIRAQHIVRVGEWTAFGRCLLFEQNILHT